MRSALLEAGCNAAKLLEAAHQTFDAVPLPVEERIEAMAAVQGTLIAPARNHSPDVTSCERPSDAGIAVASVTHHRRRTPPWTACSGTTNASEIEQRLQVERLVPLAPGEHERQWPASTFGSQVNLRGEATAGASERLVLLATHGPRGVLVRAHHGTVHEVYAPVERASCIGFTLEFLQHALPDACGGPPAEPAPNS